MPEEQNGLRLRQGSRDECGRGTPGIHLPFQSSEGHPEGTGVVGEGGHDAREAGTQQARRGPGEEQRQPEAGRGRLVPVARRDALDDAVEPQAPEVAGHAAGRAGGRPEAEPGRPVLPEVGGPDPVRPLHLGEGGFAETAVAADPLDVEETSVGGEADRPQRGEVSQPLAEPEVAGSGAGGLGPERLARFVGLRDPAVLGVEGERRGCPPR